MSFSYELKKELSMLVDAPRHCRIAELAAIADHAGEISVERAVFSADNEAVTCAASLILKKIFARSFETEQVSGRAAGKYQILIEDPDICSELVKMLKLPAGGSGISEADRFALLTVKSCCKKAYLRGAFLCAGTISDPDRSYHLEINCKRKREADKAAAAFEALGIPAKSDKRSRYYSVYIKDSEMISDLLGAMGARVSLLELENKRILRSVRGDINRRVNCETANIEKTANASARQIEDIKFILDRGGKELLSNGLDEIARVRVEYPTATLQELGEMFEPPLGKSCINHRLRKIARIAENLREKGGNVV